MQQPTEVSITLPQLCSTLPNTIISKDEIKADLLMRQMASVNEHSFGGLTPLHYAVKYSSHEFVKKLIKWRADVNAVSVNGETPLHDVSARGNVDVVNILIEHKANVNMVTYEGYTALLYAAENLRAEVIPLLFKAGADGRIKNQLGQDAQALTKNNDVCSDLVEKGLKLQDELERKDQLEQEELKRTREEEARKMMAEILAEKKEKKKAQKEAIAKDIADRPTTWFAEFWKPTKVPPVKPSKTRVRPLGYQKKDKIRRDDASSSSWTSSSSSSEEEEILTKKKFLTKNK